MASSSTGRPFRLTLLRVSEILTKKNVQNLAFLCDTIPPARQEELKDALDLFRALQGHDLLSEDNVSTLIEWLEDLKLLEASKLLRDYRRRHLEPDKEQMSSNRGMETDVATETTTAPTRTGAAIPTAAVTSQTMCPIHKDVPLKCVCVSCDSQVCQVCSVTSHSREKGCDVVGLNKIEDEIISRRAKLTEKLKNTTMRAESTMLMWEEKKTFLSKCRDIAQKEAHEDYLEMLEKVTQKMRAITMAIGKTRSVNMTNLLEEKESIQVSQIELKRLVRLNNETSDYSLPGLQKIRKATEDVKVIDGKLRKQTELAKKRDVEVSYRRDASDCDLGMISWGCLVGAVSILQKQLVKVFDRRYSTGKVWLVCVDPGDPTNEYWRHAIEVDDHRSPVVASSVAMYHGKKNHVLIAVGKVVYMIQPHWSSEVFDYVESIWPTVINDVPEGSWITNITVRFTLGEEGQEEFMVALFRSSVIKHYNLSGELVGSIETKGRVFPGGISDLACSDTTLAVLSRVSGDVILLLLTGEIGETVEQCGCFEPPSAGFVPNIVSWTGLQWLMLCMTSEEKKRWKVVEYDKKGMMVKEVLWTGCPDELDVPSSLTGYNNMGYVISASKIRAFHY